MLRFCFMSLVVSGIVFLIFRRKKSAPIWFDLATAELVGIVFAALATILLYVVFAGAFTAKERQCFLTFQSLHEWLTAISQSLFFWYFCSKFKRCLFSNYIPDV